MKISKFIVPIILILFTVAAISFMLLKSYSRPYNEKLDKRAVQDFISMLDLYEEEIEIVRTNSFPEIQTKAPGQLSVFQISDLTFDRSKFDDRTTPLNLFRIEINFGDDKNPAILAVYPDSDTYYFFFKGRMMLVKSIELKKYIADLIVQ